MNRSADFLRDRRVVVTGGHGFLGSCVVRRLEAAGFRIRAVLGDYQGGPWDTRADVWVILAER
mgnify:CR=1 FL=1